jgi:hypothetical protein
VEYLVSEQGREIQINAGIHITGKEKYNTLDITILGFFA